MVCECQKVPSESRAGNATRTGGPNVGRSSSGSGATGGSSSTTARPPGASPSGSSGNGAGGGRSSGDGSTSPRPADSSSGGRAGSSSSSSSSAKPDGGGASRGAGSSSLASPSDAQPIGYVPVIARPNESPSAFATSAIRSADHLADLPLIVASQSKSNSTTTQRVTSNSSNYSIASSPVANARPGSLLSALNNNTNHLLPRLINRLNNTMTPKF